MTTAKRTSKADKRQRIIDFLMSKTNAKTETYKGYVFITYQDEQSRNACALWSYNGIKPTYHYVFRTPEESQNFITKHKQNADRDEEGKKAMQNQAAEKNATIQEGTILVCSWGYEQTNIDFYKVVQRKGDFVTLQEIGKINTREGGFMSGYCKPDPSTTKGETFRRKLSKFGGVSISSYQYASIADDREYNFTYYA